MSRSKLTKLKERFDNQDKFVKGFIELIAVLLALSIFASIFCSIFITHKMTDKEIDSCKAYGVLYIKLPNEAKLAGENTYKVEETQNSVKISVDPHIDYVEVYKADTLECSYTYNSNTSARIITNVVFSIIFAVLPLAVGIAYVDIAVYKDKNKEKKKLKT